MVGKINIKSNCDYVESHPEIVESTIVPIHDRYKYKTRSQRVGLLILIDI